MATLITEPESHSCTAVLTQTLQIADLASIAEHDPTTCFGAQARHEPSCQMVTGQGFRLERAQENF